MHAQPSPIPAAFRATADSAQAAWPAADWWHGFGSPELDRLIADARANNQNLAAAAARVVQADAQVAISGSPLLPTVSATGQRQLQPHRVEPAAAAVSGVTTGRQRRHLHHQHRGGHDDCQTTSTTGSTVVSSRATAAAATPTAGSTACRAR